MIDWLKHLHARLAIILSIIRILSFNEIFAICNRMFYFPSKVSIFVKQIKLKLHILSQSFIRCCLTPKWPIKHQMAVLLSLFAVDPQPKRCNSRKKPSCSHSNTHQILLKMQWNVFCVCITINIYIYLLTEFLTAIGVALHIRFVRVVVSGQNALWQNWKHHVNFHHSNMRHHQTAFERGNVKNREWCNPSLFGNVCKCFRYCWCF